MAKVSRLVRAGAGTLAGLFNPNPELFTSYQGWFQGIKLQEGWVGLVNSYGAG